MNNEIKEILDNLDFNINHTKGWVEPLGLNQDTWKILLDYITNLQQENEIMRKLVDKGVENSYKKLKYLQQENEKLEKEYKSKVDDIGKLTSRIYKAIEYLEDNTFLEYRQRVHNFERLMTIKCDLLNILLNGSEGNDTSNK